jgi:epoxyqueuosine reductase
MEEIKSFFEKENIEYFAVLPYSLCRETAPEIMARESFTPKSVIIFLIPYYTGDGVNLSRYAVSLDYHLCIKDISSRLTTLLSEKFPSSSQRAYGDHSPIDERHAAISAGLGILGDNGLLLNEKYGSYVFIADVVTNIEPEELGAITDAVPLRRCERCGKCKKACPTGILLGSGSDCLSFITQKKGELTEDEAALMKKYNLAWGCDECQRVCPHNKSPKMTPVSFFYEKRIENLTSEILSEMSKDDFKTRAFAWRGRKVVERNLKILEEN